MTIRAYLDNSCQKKKKESKQLPFFLAKACGDAVQERTQVACAATILVLHGSRFDFLFSFPQGSTLTILSDASDSTSTQSLIPPALTLRTSNGAIAELLLLVFTLRIASGCEDCDCLQARNGFVCI